MSLKDTAAGTGTSTPYDKVAAVLQGVDSLLAMPQWYVNFNLAYLLAHGQTTGGTSLQNVSLQMAPGQDAWLSGVISNMWTEVFVAGSVSKVRFVLSFASGTMDYYDVTQSPPPKLSCDISNLVFGFVVDLGLATVDPTSQTVPTAVTQLTATLPAGAFTIQALFMDFENAVISQYDPTVTSFPASMPPSAVAAFPTYMNTYLRELQQVGGHILGYAVTVPNTPDPVATFPPTSLEFVTNQYQGGPNGTGLNPDLDTINYLMMTAGRSLPSNLTSWWGNFVVPSDGGPDNTWYGTMAISKQLFVDEFLLPHLAGVILGYWSLKDADGQLTPAYDEATGGFAPTGLGGSWATGPLTSHSHRTNTASNDDVDYSFTWNVQLDVVPGTNQVTIQRTVDFDIAYTHWYGIEHHALSTSFHVWYDVPLTVTITLEGVMDGQLQVSVTSSTREPDGHTVYGDPYGWDIVKTDGSYSIWESVSDTLDSAINQAVAMAMPEALPDDINQTIKSNLNLTPFVFPGGAQLNMVNPLFTNEGDLLVGLSYKS